MLHDDQNGTVPSQGLAPLIPTLVEVVELKSKTDTPCSRAAPAGQEGVDPDAVATIVLRQLGSSLDQKIGEAVARVLHEQLLGLSARVNRAVANVVRDAVRHSLEHDNFVAGEIDTLSTNSLTSDENITT